MFNFLVSGLKITSPRGLLTISRDRVFGHTDKELENRFAPNGTLDVTALMAMPLLLTSESSNDPDSPGIARVGTITKIRSGLSDFAVEYSLDPDIPPIPNAVLESLAPQLNFVISRRFYDDFHTNHWAVKDADLFRVLFTESLGRKKPTIFKFPEGPIDENMVSVMMPFDTGFNGVITALRNAASENDMECLRADNIWDDNVIIQDVVKLIGSARVVICDLSGKNANVFYETGIAHAMGQDVILIAQHDSDVPFDLRHIRHIRYLPNEQGLKELEAKVSKRLQDLIRR